MVTNDLLIALVPFIPLAGFLVIGLFVNKLDRLAGVLATVFIGLAFVLSLFLFTQLPAGQVLEVNLFKWFSFSGIDIDFKFIVDRISIIMMLNITGVGFLIHLYSIGYMSHDEARSRFFSYLNLFVFFMLILVMGSGFLLMFIGWEGVGLCSYLLIGFWFKTPEYNAAASKAFIMNRIGDLGLIAGVILIALNFNTLDFAAVVPEIASKSPVLLTLICVLLFVGAMGKSAQIPLYTWLPDAMAGPTPVSALIHAATMVTAGVYMIVRNAALFSAAPYVLDFILVIGLATAILGATIALYQNDIKKVLAYSTVSQLGFMFVALGLGAFSTGMFHMLTHAFFKALLFLGAGSVIHALSGEQDMRLMGGLKKALPITFGTMVVGVLAISGIPPFSGFFSKDEILLHAFTTNPVIWGLLVVVSILTTIYMFRMLFLTFYGNSRLTQHATAHLHESPSVILLPLIILALLATGAGFLNFPEVMGGTTALKNFLNVGDHAHGHIDHSTEWILMGIVVSLALIAIAFVYRRFVTKGYVPGSEVSGLPKVLTNKYYIDELYDAIIVKPFIGFMDFLEKYLERLGIDGIVNSTGHSAAGAGKIVRLIQSGSTGWYILLMSAGIIVLLIWNWIFNI